MRSKPHATRTNQRALEALTSPARNEVLSALGEGPATVRALAERLGRSRQALYHHLSIMERAGLVGVVASEGEGREQERVYGLLAEGLQMTDGPPRPRELETLVRASQAMLRLSAREVAAALRSSGLRREGPERELVTLRAKVRLSRPKLRQLNQHLDAIHALLSSTGDVGTEEPLYSVMLVLAPARAAGREGGSRKRAVARRSAR